jgi:hypothetical protein
MPDATEFEVLEWIVSGKPVPFEIDGMEFALRQPTPVEMDRMRLAQTRAHDKVMAEYRADGMDKEPVTAGLLETQRIYREALEAAYQQANADNDGEAARKAAEDMEDVDRLWPKNLAEERARDHARRTLARWMVDNLLNGSRDDLRRLTAPDPLAHDAVVTATQQMLQIINHDPNSRRRTE